MKLYTKTGDAGETGLIGGSRVPKNHLRVVCYGQVDELNSVIGCCASACSEKNRIEQLHQIQADLFVLGAQLAAESEESASLRIAAARIDVLEGWLDGISAALEPLRNFVLPGGCELASRFHLARTVCRRAERSVVELSLATPLDKVMIIYLNRLGDLLFACALAANAEAGIDDIPWIAPS